MSQDTLVEEWIKGGEFMLTGLPQQGFEATAAFWIKDMDDGQWYYYVVSPVAERVDSAAVYRQLHTAVRRMPRTWVDPLGVRLLGPSDPMAQDGLAILHRSPSNLATWWGGKRLGEVRVEQVYLDPLPATAPA